MKQGIDPAGGREPRPSTNGHRLPEAVSSRLLPDARACVDATLPEGATDARRIEAGIDAAFSRRLTEQAEMPLFGVTARRELQRGARVHGLLPRPASITTLVQAARG